MVCKRCNKKVSNGEGVTCRGFCGASFHAVCANVDEPFRKQLLENRDSTYWMCEKCAPLFANAHFRTLLTGFEEKFSAIPAAIQTMQGEIEKLNSGLQSLAAKVDGIPTTPTPFSTPNPWPAIHRINRSAKSAKRFRDNDGRPVNVESSIKTGTKDTNACSSIRLDPQLNDDLVWIYLSAFHPNTTENQISSFVTECLELTDNVDLKVIKLVPRGKDLNSLNFVSFKFGISEKFKDKAFSCDSWPEHIRFRQFEDNRAKNLPRVVSLSSTLQPHTSIHPSMEVSNIDG